MFRSRGTTPGFIHGVSWVKWKWEREPIPLTVVVFGLYPSPATSPSSTSLNQLLGSFVLKGFLLSVVVPIILFERIRGNIVSLEDLNNRFHCSSLLAPKVNPCRRCSRLMGQ